MAKTNTERIRELEDRVLKLEMWVGGIRWGLVVAGGALLLDFVTGAVKLWKGVP